MTQVRVSAGSQVWACLGPADLEADLAAAEPQAAELRRSLEVAPGRAARERFGAGS